MIDATEKLPHAGRIGLSVVVPMFNEAESLDAFFGRLEPILAELVGSLGQSYEIICVDDGSTDQTLTGLILHRRRNPAVKIVALSRNFGKDIALTAGLERATGAAVVPIDVDLQDPPELIPELFAKWLEGYDVVYATRVSREGDTLTKRASASWFYRVHNALSDSRIPEDTGDFRLLDQRVVEALRQLPERSRFMKGLFSWVGFRQTGIPYHREPRAHGSSKWRYWRLWNFALDGITSSSTLPLRVWTYLGGAIAVSAFVYGLYLVLRTLIFGTDQPGYASLMAAILFIGGVQLVTLGIIGEYLGRVFVEVRRRPLYLIRESFGFEPSEQRKPAWNATSTPGWQPSKTAIGGS